MAFFASEAGRWADISVFVDNGGAREGKTTRSQLGQAGAQDGPRTSSVMDGEDRDFRKSMTMGEPAT